MKWLAKLHMIGIEFCSEKVDKIFRFSYHQACDCFDFCREIKYMDYTFLLIVFGKREKDMNCFNLILKITIIKLFPSL